MSTYSHLVNYYRYQESTALALNAFKSARVNWGMLWKQTNPKVSWLTTKVDCLLMQSLLYVVWHLSQPSSLKHLDWFHQDRTSWHHVVCVSFQCMCLISWGKEGENTENKRIFYVSCRNLHTVSYNSLSRASHIVPNKLLVACDIQENTWIFGEHSMFRLLSFCNLIKF